MNFVLSGFVGSGFVSGDSASERFKKYSFNAYKILQKNSVNVKPFWLTYLQPYFDSSTAFFRYVEKTQYSSNVKNNVVIDFESFNGNFNIEKNPHKIFNFLGALTTDNKNFSTKIDDYFKITTKTKNKAYIFYNVVKSSQNNAKIYKRID